MFFFHLNLCHHNEPHIEGNKHLALLTRPREASPPGSLLIEHRVRVHPGLQVPLPNLQPRVLFQQRHLVPQDKYRHHEAHLQGYASAKDANDARATRNHID